VQAINATAGFTLFETLTAMLVLSIALVSLFEAHARALRTANVATSYAQARIFAEALLTDTVNGWNGKLVSKKGNNGRFTWSINITSESAPWAKIDTRNNWRLRHVLVSVNWGDGRQVELETLKLAHSNG
jgi:general secretion pathway protein I